MYINVHIRQGADEDMYKDAEEQLGSPKSPLSGQSDQFEDSVHNSDNGMTSPKQHQGSASSLSASGSGVGGIFNQK